MSARPRPRPTTTATPTTTRRARAGPRSEFEIRAMALEAALVEAGRTSTDAIDAFVEHLEHRMGPHHGARVVARAWTDPAFKAAAARRRHRGDGRARHRRRRGRQRARRREHRRPCTTSSSARCARATRGRCSASRPIWYKSLRLPLPGRVGARGPCCASSAPSCPTTSRSASGTPARRSATSSCPTRPAGTEALSRGRAGRDRSPATTWSASAAETLLTPRLRPSRSVRSGLGGGHVEQEASAASKARRRHSPAGSDAVALGVAAGGDVERVGGPSAASTAGSSSGTRTGTPRRRRGRPRGSGTTRPRRARGRGRRSTRAGRRAASASRATTHDS